MDKELINLSKFLSLVLRHKPQEIDLVLDGNGWADVTILIDLMSRKGVLLNEALLSQVVAEDEKNRFSFNRDKSKIRANQGHSIEVDLALSPQQPPNILFHGTAVQFIASIKQQCLLPWNRQHVHLSSDQSMAIKVGQRHGKPTALLIRAVEMYCSGFVFFLSENGVWLTKYIPVKYIDFL